MKNIKSINGVVERISFGEFIKKKVRVHPTYSDTAQSNVLIGHVYDKDNGEEAIYKRMATKIETVGVYQRPNNPYKAFALSFTKSETCSLIKVVLTTPDLEAVEGEIVNCMRDFGLPQYLVRLSPRKWILANAEDFLLYTNGARAELVCIAPLHCRILEIVGRRG